MFGVLLSNLCMLKHQLHWADKTLTHCTPQAKYLRFRNSTRKFLLVCNSSLYILMFQVKARQPIISYFSSDTEKA